MLGHDHGIAHGLGDLGKECSHFIGAAQVKLFRRIIHAVRIAEVGLGANTDQRVVRVGMIALNIMHVIGGDKIEVKLFGPRDELGVYLGLFVEAMVLQLEKKSFLTEELLKPVECGAGLVGIIPYDCLRDLAGETAAEGDDAFVMRLQQFLIDSGLVIKSLEMRSRGKAHEVLVADFIFGQQQEMVVAVLARPAVGLAVKPAAGRDLHFAADDRLEILALGLLIKIHRAMHHAMIGDGQRGEVQLHRSVDQLVQTAGAIEHRKLAVDMQVYKLVLGHESS